MKTLFLILTLGISASAFAQRCEVDMIDRYGRTVKTFYAYGDVNCMEGMKECRKFIRLNTNQYGEADCVVAGSQMPTPIPTPIPNPIPTPNPYPNPYPTPNPYPNPYPEYDAQRELRINESVIYYNQVQTVAGYDLNGTYMLRNINGFLTRNVRRESVAVTDGCVLDLCVRDRVIALSMNQEVTIAGLTFAGNYVVKNINGFLTADVRRDQLAIFQGCNGDLCVGQSVIALSMNQEVTVLALENDGQYVIRNINGFLTSNVDRRTLAVKEGCVQTRYSRICVGNQVLTTSNQYANVIAIQLDGRVVTRNINGFLTSNVDANTLIVTR